MTRETNVTQFIHYTYNFISDFLLVMIRPTSRLDFSSLTTVFGAIPGPLLPMYARTS